VRLRRGNLITTSIDFLDHKGNGIGQAGEYTVSVRGALPGDKVVARVRRVKNRDRHVEARIQRVVEPGVERSDPRCSHFGVCGGCLWQDIPYTRQVAFKQDLVTRCLEDAGISRKLNDPIVVQDPYFYRNKMEFSFGESSEGETQLGLHVGGRFDSIFDMEACFLQSEQSNKILGAVRDFVQKRGLSIYDLKSHEGLLRFLTIREGKNTGETMVILTTSSDGNAQAEDLGELLTQTFPGVKSVVHSVNSRKAQVAIGDEERVASGRLKVEERLGPFTFEISPSSFFQTNTVQAEQLYRKVVELADPGPDERILDIYCGTGAISLFLSKQAFEVVGIELAESAVADAARNCANNGVGNCTFISGAAEDVLRQVRFRGEKFETVVTDPPRPGMHPKALEELCRLKARRIVYVSCNPQALGKDLRTLELAGYEINHVQLVDMFPHTPHCEVLARLEHAGA
jgi:23S rRNA (uracil1939-C5)-methyltransferase